MILQKKTYGFYVLFFLSVQLFLSCKTDGVKPLILQDKIDRIKSLPTGINCSLNGEKKHSFKITYNDIGNLSEVVRYDKEIQIEKCSYDYVNDFMTFKTWKGTVNEGIHGNNQLVSAEYHFGLKNEKINSIERELFSNLNPKVKLHKVTSNRYIFDESSSFFVDTIDYTLATDNWVTRTTNGSFDYRFLQKDNLLRIYKNNDADTSSVLLSSHSLSIWTHELRVLFCKLLTTKVEKENLLFTSVLDYIDTYQTAAQNKLPYEVSGDNIQLEIDTHGRLIRLITSGGLELNILYDE